MVNEPGDIIVRDEATRLIEEIIPALVQLLNVSARRYNISYQQLSVMVIH
jgi:hypothetical protein